jgi:uncharacterized membrane protein
VTGVIQAVDERGLVSWAHDLPIAIGDAVPENDVIAEVHGDRVLDATTSLRGMVAIGLERTIDQDPGFVLRLMADIAVRALSPAVNDPTTAVQVLSRIQDLLRCIGKTYLRVPARPRDERGDVRVLLRAPRWEDYLALGVTEIRAYGGNSIQIVRALRRHLEDLHREVRPPYRAGVEEELRRLEAVVETRFAASPDLDRALQGDAQGLGGR